MSIKDSIRRWINQNSLTRRWFVAVCARFTVPLYTLQRFLSAKDLKGKLRMFAWRQVLASFDNASLEKIEVVAGSATFFYQDGCAFKVTDSAVSNSRALWIDAEYERAETALLRRIVKPGWTAVDAGANFGWYAIHLSHLVGAEGNVFAFEPVPATFQELESNAALNSCENLELFCKAIGNSVESIDIYVPQIALGSGAASQFLDTGEKIQVPMTRLDDFVDDKGLTRVDFIKADIEGGELALLRGGEQLLTKFHPTILIEIVDIHCQRFGHSPEDVYNCLVGKGYTGRHITAQGELVDLDPRHLPNGNFLFEPQSS
ncbi:FkbM family methyltransferase [Mycobacterium sp. E342]|uniref:FkbM family methyltransferase n=1 Tax=Mycobacterium sp. E342 TaxID=1834147 RepID=UPI0018D44A5E|nr:FkbM family methyltransferase [Mycobacterium sp. E342]